MSTPNKEQYESALKAVEKYEKRQKELTELNKELGYCLSAYFKEFKFDVNKKKGEVIFAGVGKDNRLKLSKAICSDGDAFEEVIGKLIAVKRALDEDVECLEKYIEKNTFTMGTIEADGLSVNTGLYYDPVRPSGIRYTF